MEARVASVLHGIARLSFRVGELPLRDDDAVRSYPPARRQQWSLQQCLVPEFLEQVVEVLKGRYQDGIQQPTAERVVEVPKSISRHSRVSPRSGFLRKSSRCTKLSSWNEFWRRTVHRLGSRVNSRDFREHSPGAHLGAYTNRQCASVADFREHSPGAHLGVYSDRRGSNAADCEGDRRSGGVSPA